MAGNGFAAADRIYAFVGFGFQVDSVGRDTERFCQSFAHFGEMRAEFGALENYNDVDMVDSEQVLIEKLAGVFEKEQAVGAFPLRIGVGEMCADVA